jgi:hypothetical protein
MNVIPMPAAHARSGKSTLPVDFGTSRRRSWLRRFRTPLWRAIMKVATERMARAERRQHHYDNLGRGVVFTTDGEGMLYVRPNSNSNPVL